MPIRPQQREHDPVYDDIAEQQEEDQHPAQHGRMTPPAPERSFRVNIRRSWPNVHLVVNTVGKNGVRPAL
jgi:hypothetical protein